ncbi:hypothetical protein AUL38_15695 [Leucobacter sp. G161]|nr:hypothetical protein AUL38_15695 [Leucobacter sp. G161]
MDGLSGVVEVVLDCIVKILRETPPNRHRPTERAWPNALFGNAHQQALARKRTGMSLRDTSSAGARASQFGDFPRFFNGNTAEILPGVLNASGLD